jgi:predicted RNA-binding protein with PIN domain
VTIVLVDGENVRRSRWPNLSAERLVELVGAWAAARGLRAVVVFDGPAPGGRVGERELEPHLAVAGTGRASADDWLARRAGELRDGAEPFWLVTSDRGLRARAAAGAERVVGGGSFLHELSSRSDPAA